ncbi:SPOR domain-containing protein [Seongchinamella unica]|nr:SPOR domain-containing protein [Seongchinamella unica]
MNEVLKQRLVGALILVALGVVFWPIIFVEPGEEGGAAEARIPPRPQVQTAPVEAPDIAGLRPSREIAKESEPADRELPALSPEDPLAESPVPSAASEGGAVTAGTVPISEPAPATVNSKTRSEAPVKPALDSEGVPITWILRVASVSSDAKADQLRRDLLAMGHKAYVKKIRSNGKTLFRVYVGPKAEKARLQQIQGSIDRKFGVSSLITRYYP